jgi:hypothetical protein
MPYSGMLICLEIILHECCYQIFCGGNCRVKFLNVTVCDLFTRSPTLPSPFLGLTSTRVIQGNMTMAPGGLKPMILCMRGRRLLIFLDGFVQPTGKKRFNIGISRAIQSWYMMNLSFSIYHLRNTL